MLENRYVYVLGNAWYASISDFSFKDSNGGSFQDCRDLMEKNLLKHLHKASSCNKPMKMSTPPKIFIKVIKIPLLMKLGKKSFVYPYRILSSCNNGSPVKTSVWAEIQF